MKLTAIILFAFSFTQCKSLQFDKSPPFKIIQASYKNWVGGQPGVRGVNVFINYTSETKIEFDSIYFIGRVVKIEINEMKGIKYLAGRFNTSTVNSRDDLILHNNATKEVGNDHPENKTPFELKENEAVISYKEGAIIKYYKISDIEKAETDFYP